MKKISIRHYNNQAGMSPDYFVVREFFIKKGYCEFTFARWDWMITHGYLDREHIGCIGVVEEEGKIVGMVTFDCRLGWAALITLPGYEEARREMLHFAEENLKDENNELIIVCQDIDEKLQQILAEEGYVAGESREHDAIFLPQKTSMEYTLPEGFYITDLEEHFDQNEYERVLWKGFNHELDKEGIFDELTFSEEKVRHSLEALKRPNVNLKEKIVVVAPNGHFASHCGMWYDKESGYAVVEPVCTDPEYRGMGIGKAAVLEGIKRVSEMGAERVFVGSDQQFYYNIGFRPYMTATEWKKK